MADQEGTGQARDRVLFVDDDSNLLESLRRVFEPRYELRLAGSGQEALDVLAGDGPFMAMVSDLRMPGMSGIELLARAATLYPDTVRLLLTGYADFENAVEAVNQGYVFRFLTKPCPPEVLGKALDQAAQQHHLVETQREVHSLKRFKRLLEGIVQGFSALLEARDPYLAGHQERVSRLACAMGRELGLGAEQLETLRMAALLHDIGKVHVPSDFLNRPGPLRREEYAIVQTHPEVGFQVLQHLGEDWPVAIIIRQHHERLDGTGYPQGLGEAQIVPGARVLAVADVVDAMCSHRPYRPSRGLAAALEELEKNKGRLYGGEEVEACLRLFRVKGYSLTDAADSSRKYMEEDWTKQSTTLF